MLPASVMIDAVSGAVAPATGRYVKRLSELAGFYRDDAALAALMAAKGDIAAYEVVEFKQPGADLFFGTTTMQPGLVGEEYFMTRGHFHARPDRGEVYHTQSGEGLLLLLQSRAGGTRVLEMKPGICNFIPPDWAHRSVNTGDAPLVFVWVCNIDAGNDYGEIRERGMRSLIVRRGGAARVVPNLA